MKSIARTLILLAILLSAGSCTVFFLPLRYYTPPNHRVFLKLPCEPTIKRESSKDFTKDVEIHLCDVGPDRAGLLIHKRWRFDSRTAAYEYFTEAALSIDLRPPEPEITDGVARGVPVRDLVFAGLRPGEHPLSQYTTTFVRERMLWYDQNMYIARYTTRSADQFADPRALEFAQSLEPKTD